MKRKWYSLRGFIRTEDYSVRRYLDTAEKIAMALFYSWLTLSLKLFVWKLDALYSCLARAMHKELNCELNIIMNCILGQDSRRLFKITLCMEARARYVILVSGARAECINKNSSVC